MQEYSPSGYTISLCNCIQVAQPLISSDYLPKPLLPFLHGNRDLIALLPLCQEKRW